MAHNHPAHNVSERLQPMLKFAHSKPALADGHTRANMSFFELINSNMLIGAGTAVAGSSVGVFAFFRAWAAFRSGNANDAANVNMIERLEGEIKRKDEQAASRDAMIAKKDETINTLWREKSQLESKLTIIENNVEFLKEQNILLVDQVKTLTAEVRRLSGV